MLDPADDRLVEIFHNWPNCPLPSYSSSNEATMAYGSYKNINDQDMAAIVAYLRSLKPLPFGGAPAAKP